MLPSCAICEPARAGGKADNCGFSARNILSARPNCDMTRSSSWVSLINLDGGSSMSAVGPSHQQIQSRSQVAVATSGCCDMRLSKGISIPYDVNSARHAGGSSFTSTVWLAATPAAADDFETCARASGDVAIAACTRAIISGRYSGRQLAAILTIVAPSGTESKKATRPLQIATKRSGLIRTTQ